jgi:thiamine-monophosphate kinase
MTKGHLSGKNRKLSDIGEFGIIRRFRKRCSVQSPEILKGIGDDSAALRMKAGISLITSDMMLEGIHFDLSLTTFFQLGFKILAVSISDILAMGGTPQYFLMNLGIPGHYRVRDIDELYSGVTKIARKFRIALVGGDTCASRNGLILSGTLVGKAEKTIARSGASPGDGIYLNNTVGDSAMGLVLLKKLRIGVLKKIQDVKHKMKNRNLKINNQILSSRDVFNLIKRHLMPEPVSLRKLSGITSMIDVSDGLLIDLSHICDESNVGAVLYEHRIPLSEELAHVSKKLDIDPLQFALRGGEDYTLLFTSPSERKLDSAVKIGEIIKKGRFIVDRKGKKRPFTAEGYEHFK